MTSVVVQYMRNNPQMLNERFEDIALLALNKAWPCK